MRGRGRLETLSIESDPSRFHEVRSWAAAVAEAAGLDEVATDHLRLAVTEVCANAYRHAYDSRMDGRIDLQAEIREDGLGITVRDYGTTFDMSEYRPPVISELPEHGYGIFLIHKVMDEVHYASMGIGTRVAMIIRRRRRRAAS